MSQPGEGWFLVLMIWGDRYPDSVCNSLIRAAGQYSQDFVGSVVLTDRIDRQIDPIARQILIARDFDTPTYRQRGLPIKISMFDIPDLPRDARCLFLDLDSVILGSLDPLAACLDTAPLWTMGGSKPFSARWRWIARLTKNRLYAFGNASFFAFRNRFSGNPTEQFRRFRDQGQLQDWPLRDERFVARCCQAVIRGISPRHVVNFKREFLSHTLWLAKLRSVLRKTRRQDIRIITFTGEETKPELLLALPDGAIMRDKKGRVGRWSEAYTSGLKARIVQALSG